MTDITLEQRARFEGWLRGTTGFKKCKARGVPMSFRKNVLGDYGDYRVNDRWLAWGAALRLSAGADWVLVPREPTPEMMEQGALEFPNSWGNGDKTDGMDARACYRAMLAAAPRHEPGEGS